VLVSWVPYRCPPAVAARGEVSGAGHQVVPCQAPGCRSVSYPPRCDPTWLKLVRIRRAVDAVECLA
jgi:hypothetical protein